MERTARQGWRVELSGVELFAWPFNRRERDQANLLNKYFFIFLDRPYKYAFVFVEAFQLERKKENDEPMSEAVDETGSDEKRRGRFWNLWAWHSNKWMNGYGYDLALNIK